MLTGKIYNKFDSLHNEACFIISEELIKLRARGFKAQSASGLVFDHYGVPWGDLSEEKFPTLCAMIPFIHHVGIDRPRNEEILEVGVTVSMVKNRDMRFLIYSQAHKPHKYFDVVKVENCNAYIREACDADMNEVRRTPRSVQDAVVPFISTSYEMITNQCNNGETLLIQKIYVQLFETLPPPPEQLRINIGNYAVPFYVIFTKKKAKQMYSERCKTKNERKKSSSGIKLAIKQLMKSLDLGKLRRAR
jgi:hypothetical protein